MPRLQACEWIGPCKDCLTPCVLNRDMVTIKGEIIGATLAEIPTNVAAMVCPALAIAMRYGRQVPQPVSLVRSISFCAHSLWSISFNTLLARPASAGCSKASVYCGELIDD